jgi:hypothetical protein
MKTINFAKFALVIVIMATVTTTSFGQRWNNASRFANNQAAFSQPTCVNQITNLTDKQISQITDLEKKHQTEMDKFRTERRSTFDLDEKSALRAEMDKKVFAHQSEVKALLTEDQQNQYDLLHTYANPNYAQGRQFNGAGAGNNQAFVRGRGQGCNNVAYNRGYNRGMRNNGFVRGGGRGNSNFYAARGNGKFAGRQSNFRGAGYGRRAGMNAAGGRGYGHGYYSAPTDTIENTKVN